VKMLGFLLCVFLNGNTIYHDIHFYDEIVSRVDVPVQLGSSVVEIPVINNCYPYITEILHSDGTIQRIFTYKTKSVKQDKVEMKKPSEIKSEKTVFPSYFQDAKI